MKNGAVLTINRIGWQHCHHSRHSKSECALLDMCCDYDEK